MEANYPYTIKNQRGAGKDQLAIRSLNARVGSLRQKLAGVSYIMNLVTNGSGELFL